MLIKYYRDSNLAYASRKRYNTFNVTAFAEEDQNAVKLGDGATTSIKTSASNICDYVTIGTSRWFVTSYYYMNGGQVTLNLQRDVIGENGIDNFFGKIERGYANNVLLKKKELSLNQILQSRKPLKSNSLKYGNYTINNHTNEMWGIMYFNKPSDSSNKITIPISAQNVQVMDYGYIPNNSIRYNRIVTNFKRISFSLSIFHDIYTVYGKYNYSIICDLVTGECSVTNRENGEDTFDENYRITVNLSNHDYLKKYYDEWAQTIASSLYSAMLLGNVTGFNTLTLPQLYNEPDYSDVVIEYNNNYIKYSQEESFGSFDASLNRNDIYEYVKTIIQNTKPTSFVISSISYPSGASISNIIRAKSSYSASGYKYTYVDVTQQVESSQIEISTSSLFVDEPFYICVIPLYNVFMTGDGLGAGVDISRSVSFKVFNDIILKSSGENAYLVDAQIYPYCPQLSSVNCLYSAETGEDGNGNPIYTDVPIFNISSTSFETDCFVSLNPYSDIKKEYIAREYTIVDAMKSSKFTFNYYDYFNSVHNSIKVTIKTSLKPFSIVSSAVLDRDADAIAGMTFSSDINGCISSGGVYECSLASNAFETYARQNTNYQELFNLDKSELEYQHKVELANDIVSSVTNTMSASMMGAIAGAAAADVSWFGTTVSKPAGAAIGAAAAGTAVGASMAGQTIANQKLREYETYLQQARFDLSIGTIKNLPNSTNRVSSFNEIAMKEFYFAIEIYECSQDELDVIDVFISNYGYLIGVYGMFSNYTLNGFFIKGELMRSGLVPNLHNIARNELAGGVYIYE